MDNYEQGDNMFSVTTDFIAPFTKEEEIELSWRALGNTKTDI